jgi:hypothetical protein
MNVSIFNEMDILVTYRSKALNSSFDNANCFATIAAKKNDVLYKLGDEANEFVSECVNERKCFISMNV